MGNNVGVQFHPEVDHLQLADWFAGGVEEARDFGVDTDALLDETKRETPAARVRAAELVDLFPRTSTPDGSTPPRPRQGAQSSLSRLQW